MVWIELLQLSVLSRGRAVLPASARLTLMSGITVGTVAAVLISFMHLGSPIKAVFAMNNLGTSWLSREILLVILFGGGVVLATVMWWRGWGSETSRNIVGRISAVLGLALVYAMARLYMFPTTPSWNTLTTPIFFFASCLILGGIVVLVFLQNARSDSPSPPDARVSIMWALVICLGVEIVLTPLQADILYNHPLVVHGDGLAFLNMLLGLRVLSVAVALGFLISFLVMSDRRPNRWMLATIALVLIAEILGRYTFYAYYYRIGV
jgi:anaerobic dimethyl sulfoxide reductase subunit C (anchor subunit)